MINLPLLKVIHVDDDPGSIRHMKLLLTGTDGIEYSGGFTSAQQAIDFLKEETADIALLDVEMPDHDGLWLAEQLRGMGMDIVFVTAHAGYAAKAFEVCALDYTLKPIDENKLNVLIARVRHRRQEGNIQQLPEQIEEWFRSVIKKQPPTRIFINMIGKIAIVNLADVCLFEADASYTNVLMKGGKQHISSKHIKIYDDYVKDHEDFLRISRSYIVNRRFIVSIERNAKTRKLFLAMEGGKLVETTYKSKQELIDALGS